MTSRHRGLSLALREVVLFMKFDQRSFRRDAETNTPDACAIRRKLRAGSPRILQSEPKTPRKQRSGVGPDPRLGIAQDHYDDVAPWARTACNQTVTSRFS